VTPPVPRPPADLSKPFRDLWTATRKALDRQGTWEDHDADLLTSYIRLRELAHDAREDMRGEDGNLILTVPGSKGQPAPHPNLKTVRDAEVDSRSLAAMLLLTPQKRRELEIRAKEASGGKLGL
jgi:P27 family predicted phage terminase small subunit